MKPAPIIRTLDAPYGTSITSMATEALEQINRADMVSAMAALAHSKILPDHIIKFTFNGIDLEVKSGDTLKSILANYNNQINSQRTKYDNSHTQQETQLLQEKLDNVVHELNTYTDVNNETINVFLDKIETYLDILSHGGISSRHTQLIPILEKLDFNKHDALNLPEDQYKVPEIALKYIMGQIMDCVSHDIYPNPANLYLQKVRQLYAEQVSLEKESSLAL